MGEHQHNTTEHNLRQKLCRNHSRISRNNLANFRRTHTQRSGGHDLCGSVWRARSMKLIANAAHVKYVCKRSSCVCVCVQHARTVCDWNKFSDYPHTRARKTAKLFFSLRSRCAAAKCCGSGVVMHICMLRAVGSHYNIYMWCMCIQTIASARRDDSHQPHNMFCMILV